jgi:hypothetical protein
MMDNVKTRARWAAGVILDEIPEFSGCIGRICEDLESSSKTYEAADFRKVSWATLVGAARAAARLKGRYDAETDSVTAVQIVPRPLLFIENRMGPIYKDSAMGALGLPDAILDSVKEYSTHLGDTYLVVILAKWRASG